VKREMRASAPGLIFLGTTSLRQLLRDALYSERTPALVEIGVGAAGLLLTAAGLLGVVLHAVNRRMRELGVRVALGARQADLVCIVMRHGLGVAARGAVAGAIAYFGVARPLARFVHGIRPYDALSVGGGVALMLLVGLAGSLYPAWKAASVDPSSDHGDQMGAHRLVGKNVFEECVHGRAASICDFAGVQAPEALDGRSVRPLLGANPRGWRDVLVSELSEGRMLRAGHHKYISYQRGGVRSEFLFDLQKDPGETTDLAALPGSAGELDRCRALLQQWTERSGGTFERTKAEGR
jgi:hypothetical protein